MKSKTPDSYNNANALGQFLNKAQVGMQSQPDIVDIILDELALDPDTESIVSKLQSQFGISYEDALDRVDEVVSMLYKNDTVGEMIPEQEEVDAEEIEPVAAKYNYNLDEPSAADDMYYPDDTGWEDQDDLAMGDEQALSLERKGGAVSKKKFVKDTLRKLKKASEGMEQSESNEADIRDTPIGGRQSKVNNFRRGIKDLGNEFYAKDIYDNTMQLQQQVSGLSPMANEDLEMGAMNIPEAKKGREQKKAGKEANQMAKDWQKMFGDIAVGYMGVPGMPSYLSMIPPGMMPNQMSNQMPQVGMTPPMNVPGPLVNMSFKKGPWWSGKREWTAEGIPANMLMGMGMGMVPEYGSGNQSMAYDTRRRYPGEIIRTKSTVPVVSKEIGGAVNDPEMDQYGNLERFIYGGNEMPEPPILQYEDDYMSSKNVDDPFMFKEGGLYKYQGTGNSQVNPDDYNAWLKRKVEKEALDEYNEWMNRNAQNPAVYDANTNDRVYQQILQRRMAGLTGQSTQSNQGMGVRNQNPELRGQYPQMRGQYPTAPSVREQIRNIFSPIKKDFTWYSQAGPATTLDGQPYRVSGQPTQPSTTQGVNQPAGQPNPMQPGYMYDVRYDKGSFWKGSPKSVTFTGRWTDPNAATRTTQASQFNDGKGPTLNTAESTNTQSSTSASSSVFPPGDPRGEYMKSQLTLPTPPAQSNVMPAGFPANTAGPRATEEDQMGYGGYMAYGGYIPEFDPGGQFDPNTNNVFGGIGQGSTGPCTEAEVQDPNSPCYNPNYKPGSTPQDFQVKYDINEASTLNTGNIANIMGAVGTGIQEGSAVFDNRYNDQYLADRTTSDNMVPTNYLDYRGGYSGLNQRALGAPRFTGIVKKGGQIKYKEGEVYDLDQAEIGRILAAGGQIEFI